MPRTFLPPFLRRVSLTLLLVLFFVAGPGQAAEMAGAKVSSEQLTAVYLYNFLHFVSWPPEADSLPRRIAVIGDDPRLAQVLRDLQTKIAVGDSAIEIELPGAYREGMPIPEAHLLYICASEQAHIPRILAAVVGRPLLTVGDGEDFLAQGGMIALVGKNGKLRWAINRAAATDAGLRLSAKLLDIAVKIIGNYKSSLGDGNTQWLAFATSPSEPR